MTATIAATPRPDRRHRGDAGAGITDRHPGRWRRYRRWRHHRGRECAGGDQCGRLRIQPRLGQLGAFVAASSPATDAFIARWTARKAGVAPKTVPRADRDNGIIALDTETQLTGVSKEAWSA